MRLAPRVHRSRSPVAIRRAADGFTRRPLRRTGAEDSRVRGRLVCSTIRRSPGRPPSTTIARPGGFAPTRLARTPHVAAARADHDGSTVIALDETALADRLVSSAPRGSAGRIRRSSPPGSERLRARRYRGGPPPAPLREKRCDPLHPRCLPSQDFPLRGVSLSTACHQPVDGGPAPLLSPRLTAARTVRRGRR